MYEIFVDELEEMKTNATFKNDHPFLPDNLTLCKNRLENKLEI